MTLIVDPIRQFEIQGQVIPLQVYGNTIPVAAGNSLIAAIPDYRIRIMGLILQSDTAASGSILFKGPGIITSRHYGPPNTAAPWLLPIINSGYFETDTGAALTADVVAVEQQLTLFYITYKP